MLGHDRMADLTHAMETALDLLRDGKIAVSEALIDTLLEALDALTVLRTEIDTLETADFSLAPVIANLERWSSPAPQPSRPASGKSNRALPDEIDLLARKTVEDGTPVFRLDILIQEGCDFPAIRAYQVVQALKRVGEVLWTRPSAEEIDRHEVGRGVAILLATSEDGDVLPDVAAKVADVAGIRLTPFEIIDPELEVVEPAILIEHEAPSRGKATRGPFARTKKTINFDIERLDAIMSLVEELVIERTRLLDYAESLEDQTGPGPVVDVIRSSSDRVGRIAEELQRHTLQARMQPIEEIFSRFPRMVRDLARKQDKQIEFIVEGQDTGIDRAVMEEIGNPLLHILRNAIDHGLETPAERIAAGKDPTGTLKLAAIHADNQVVLEIQDDGRGMSPEKIRQSAVGKGIISRQAAERLSDADSLDLIFTPGFSTAAEVTDISGRGVGLDIVRSNIEKLGGEVVVSSTLGAGTTFSIHIPLTLGIIPALLVSVADGMYALPMSAVTETARVDLEHVQHNAGQQAIYRQESVLPLIHLRELFGKAPADPSDRLRVVTVKSADRHVGLVVDWIIGGRDIVIRPLDDVVGLDHGLSGATILGDGKVGLIVDIPKIMKRLPPDPRFSPRIERYA